GESNPPGSSPEGFPSRASFSPQMVRSFGLHAHTPDKNGAPGAALFRSSHTVSFPRPGFRNPGKILPLRSKLSYILDTTSLSLLFQSPKAALSIISIPTRRTRITPQPAIPAITRDQVPSPRFSIIKDINTPDTK